MSQNSETTEFEQHWSALTSIADAELWIAQYDQALQQAIGQAPSIGHGVCFTLTAGGALYLHTTSYGDLVLDLEPDADWVAPVIAAATHTQAPSTQLWILPGDSLTQLILGLNPLIASTRLVRQHRFRGRGAL